jgi:lipopolysaccharide/colanic/teichoic acid biosynthesis glycosyltransferase
MMRLREPYLFTKRLFDVSLATVALVILGPLFLLTAALIRLRLGRPVFFRQTRSGLGERPFRIWKFRTMVACTNAHGRPLPDAQRLTPFGRFLRAASLDELPQLLNVLSGEMSLIGPRPLLPEYLPRYTPFQRRRHEVKPGITGWAQINGRNALTWEQRFALDVWYTGQRSIWLDFRILWMTVWKVVLRENVSQAGHMTMPEFSGEMDQVQNV